MRDKFRVKNLPIQVETCPVVKGVFLGWQIDLAKTPGYFCFVVTYDTRKDGEPDAYSVHLMRATSIGGNWLRIDSRRGLFWSQAESAFTTYDKLAIVPGRN